MFHVLTKHISVNVEVGRLWELCFTGIVRRASPGRIEFESDMKSADCGVQVGRWFSCCFGEVQTDDSFQTLNLNSASKVELHTHFLAASSLNG